MVENNIFYNFAHHDFAITLRCVILPTFNPEFHFALYFQIPQGRSNIKLSL